MHHGWNDIFWFVKAIASDSYSGDLSYLPVFILFSNVAFATALIITFKFVNKRKDTFLNGDMKTRLNNFIKASLYRHSVMEISPVLFMMGFVMFGKIYFIIEVVLAYALLAIYFPTAKRLSKELKLEIRKQD